MAKVLDWPLCQHCRWPRCSMNATTPARLSCLSNNISQRCGRGALSTSSSEEHTSELQSLMRTKYSVFCLQNHSKAPSPTTQYPSPPAAPYNLRSTRSSNRQLTLLPSRPSDEHLLHYS